MKQISLKTLQLAAAFVAAFFSGVAITTLAFILINTSEEKTTESIEVTRIPAYYENNLAKKKQNGLEEKELSHPQVTATVKQNTPKWQKNSKPVKIIKNFSQIAIILDDIGVVRETSTEAVNSLPKEITFAFLPYGESTQELSHEAYKKGHEIMVHLPMQPLPSASGYVADPGPNALFTYMTKAELEEKTHININSLKDIAVGANNHMGSKFTEWEEGLNTVLDIIEDEKMLFLDSITTAETKVNEVIQNKSIPFLKRNVFLDHSQKIEDIQSALEKTERVAKKQGYAIAIGHPHPETLAVLKEWVLTLPEKQVQLVPITTLINR